MLQEAQWVSSKAVPTLNEYMTNAYVSFALGPIVLPTLYLLGPKLSEEVVQGPEYHKLYKLMSNCGRLFNDINSFEVRILFLVPRVPCLVYYLKGSNFNITEGDEGRETERRGATHDAREGCSDYRRPSHQRNEGFSSDSEERTSEISSTGEG